MKSLETRSGCSSAIDFGACMLSHFSHVQLFATLWTEAHQAPLTMEFSRQEYWRVLPCPPPGDLPNPGLEPESPALPVDSLPTEPSGKPITLHYYHAIHLQYHYPFDKTYTQPFRGCL